VFFTVTVLFFGKQPHLTLQKRFVIRRKIVHKEQVHLTTSLTLISIRPLVCKIKQNLYSNAIALEVCGVRLCTGFEKLGI